MKDTLESMMTAFTLRPTPLAKVDEVLRTLWRETNAELLRMQTMTIVALCETPWHVQQADVALAAVASLRGARTVRAAWDNVGETSILAEVSLHPRVDAPDNKPPATYQPRPAGERITLFAHSDARAHIGDAIARFVHADVPLYVWWVGDLPDDETLFHRVAFRADAGIFDSTDMDLRDLGALKQLSARPKDRYSLADFAWHRIAPIQEMTARFFDDPANRALLPELETVEVTFRQREQEPEPCSNPAALFVGWLATRLSFRVADTASPNETGVYLLQRPNGGIVKVHFIADCDSKVTSGAIVRVVLTAGQARFDVTRDPLDPSVFCWESDGPSPIAKQCVRFPLPDASSLLLRAVSRPVRDDVFEASLHAATQLLKHDTTVAC